MPKKITYPCPSNYVRTFPVSTQFVDEKLQSPLASATAGSYSVPERP